MGWRVAAAILALAAAVLMMGLIDLGTLVGTSDPRYSWPVSLDVSWGGLFTFLLAGSYTWIAIRPRRALPAVVQLAVTSAALVVGAAAGLGTGPLWIAVPVAASAVAFARVLRQPIERPRWRRPSPLHLALAVAALPLWVPYVVSTAAVSASPHEAYITNGIDHWPVQVAAGVALAVLPFLLAVWPAVRPLIRGCAALTAALIGVAQLAYPEREGSVMSELWAVVVVVWAVLVALVPPSASSERPTART